MTIKAKTATIESRGEGNATTGIQAEGLALVGIRVPSAFAGGQISVQASFDNSDWQEIFLANGLAPLAGIPAHPGRLIALEPDFTAPWPYLRIACDTRQQPGTTFALRLEQAQGVS